MPLPDSPLIVLDRDGVINEDSAHYIRSVDAWIPIPGSLEAIARLKRAGFRVAVATNQSGIGRRYYTQAVLEQMHEKMQSLLSEQFGVQVDCIVYCPHHPDDQCNCRKPKAGLLEQIQQSMGISVAGAWMVGDSLRDLTAGDAMGLHTALVRTGKGQQTEQRLAESPEEFPSSVLVFDTLSEFCDYICDAAD